MKILLVEDDSILAQSLVDLLTQRSYTVEHCADGEEALYWLTNYEFSAVILDWELPSMSGIELLSSYRNSGGRVPVLMLTGRKSTNDKVEGLDCGADDYLAKPFEPQELLARLRALLRRPPDMHLDTLVVGDLELNTSSCTVTRGGVSVNLGRKEYAILELMMRSPGRIFSSEALIERLWAVDTDVTEVSVRSHIARLRTKLDEACANKPVPLKNVYGMGYKLEHFD